MRANFEYIVKTDINGEQDIHNFPKDERKGAIQLVTDVIKAGGTAELYKATKIEISIETVTKIKIGRPIPASTTIEG